MGVMIYLDVDFTNIDTQKWESVYEESLLLIENYPFMDKIVDEETYPESFIYTDRTRERLLAPWRPNYKGWHIIGDLNSYNHAESFMLVRDRKFYNMNEQEGKINCEDVYFSLVGCNSDNKEISDLKIKTYSIFDSKTQGYDYHLFILSIACLIEDRLKPCAIVYGDITIGQINESLEWANDILSDPIHQPDRCNNQLLLKRINGVLKTESAQFEAFIDLTLSGDTPELGIFLREHFSKGILFNYWDIYIKNNSSGTLGFSWAIKRYLDMHFDIESLCDICILSNNQEYMSIESFITAILKQGICQDKNDAQDFLKINTSVSKIPETVGSILGKSILSMAGARDKTMMFISEKDLKDIFDNKFNDRNLIESIFKKYHNNENNEKNNQEDIFDSLQKELENIKIDDFDDDERYEIMQIEDMIFWQKGQTIKPELKDFLTKINVFANNLKNELIKEYEKGRYKDIDRFVLLIKCNNSFLINKKTWDYINKNLFDPQIFFKVVALLQIKAEEIIINTVMKSIFNNMHLFKIFCSSKKKDSELF